MKRKICSVFFILFTLALLLCVTSCNAMKGESFAPGGNDAVNPNKNNAAVGTTPEMAPSSPENDQTNNTFVENPFVSTEKSL